MNTHGHESVAEEAGEPLLKAAFTSPAGEPRVTAFYLGNWIADLSQVYDPVAIARARDAIALKVHEIFDAVLSSVYMLRGRRLVPLEQVLDDLTHLRTRVIASVEAVFNSMISSTPGTPSQWFKTVQPGVLLKGYFKFVQPPEKGQPPKMDLAAYVAVFDTLFKQYYPYEHLDRPDNPNAVMSTENAQYDDRRDADPSDPGTTNRPVPDMYVYLREDLRIIAGRLTDLELNWASKYLIGPAPVRDDDVAWNIGLARLGHAIHGVEDFFAHSNFIEHAAKVLGTRYIPMEFQRIDYFRFLKRLKRYDYMSVPEDWKANQDEDYVVTGYFDFVDTMFSLAHIVEAGLPGFGEETTDITRHARVISDFAFDPEMHDQRVNKEIDAIVESFVQILQDPTQLNADNTDNEIVNAIKKAVEDSFLNDVDKFISALKQPKPDPAHFRALFEAMPAFRDLQALADQKVPGTSPATSAAAARVLAAFLEFTSALLVPIRLGQAGKSLFDAIKTATEFAAEPEVWIVETLVDKVAEYAIHAALFFAKEGLYTKFGLERIGCHSLMAKDHGQEVLYKEMKDCATALHYYVVQTMVRKRDPNAPGSQQWVDWLELIEYFTQHPRAGVACTVSLEIPLTKVHVLTDADRAVKTLDELFKKLARDYAPLTLMPTGVPFDDRKILQANCSTKLQKLNASEALESTLAPLLLGPAAIPLKLRRVIIPYVRAKLTVCDPSVVSPRWYMAVMKDDWKAIKSKNPHTLKFHATKADAEALRDHGDQLRVYLEQLYRPTLPVH